MQTKHYVSVLLTSAVLLAGCVKEPTGPGNEPVSGEYFDFATTTTYILTVTYPLSSVGYTDGILFDVFGEDPDRVSQHQDGSLAVVRRTDITPVFRAFTQSNGTFTGSMQIPSSIKTLWICTGYPGLPAKVSVPVVGTSITANITFSATGTKSLLGTRGATHTYPADMYPIDDLDDWDNNLGIPSYLNPGGIPKILPTGLLADIHGVLPETQDLLTGPHAYLMEGDRSHDIKLAKAAKVDMTFVNDGAVLTNTVGYYIYPTNTPPTTPSDITRKYIAFPNASALGSFGGLVPGDYVRLKYFDGTQWQETIPAGYSIGFFLLAHGFNGGLNMGWGNNASGNIREVHLSNNMMHFSDPALNYPNWTTTPDQEWKRQQTVALYDYSQNGRNLVVIGFEDMNNGGYYISGDRDFNDVVFYIQADPVDAIDVPDDRDDDMDPEPEPEEYTMEYFGTLAFEDLWPSTGDYDMNDVGLEYYCQVVRNKANQVLRVIDQFVPVHKGASYENGFGYQYGVPASAVKSVNWTVVPSKPRPSYTLDGLGLENGQALATVMLFSNGKDEVNGPTMDYTGGQQSPVYTYTITTEFNTPQSIDAVGYPPYNPFIVVKTASGDARNREVHLPNYRPTSLVDLNLFGTSSDRSDQVTKWYVSGSDFPFAINIPTRNFRFPNETVRIDQVYSEFNAWVRSGGTENADWYK